MLPTHLNIRTGWVCNDVEVFLNLGALAKLRKATITFLSVCLSVCPSIRTERLGSHWTDFHEIWYLGIFRKSAEKI